VKPSEDQFSTSADEPLPEWERDLLAGSAAAPAPAEETQEIQESPVTDAAQADADIAAAETDAPEIAQAEATATQVPEAEATATQVPEAEATATQPAAETADAE
jgi:small subunit ribosomal protein S2